MEIPESRCPDASQSMVGVQTSALVQSIVGVSCQYSDLQEKLILTAEDSASSRLSFYCVVCS